MREKLPKHEKFPFNTIIDNIHKGDITINLCCFGF